ncbi:MAG: type II toxin-antitoxin system Phd/YefM family antitoxin [Opitutales bacterium]
MRNTQKWGGLFDSQIVKRKFDNLRIIRFYNYMKTISVRTMKAKWAEIEAQVREGESFEVVNRGRPTARIVPAAARRIVSWDNHLETAAQGKGRSAEETVRADRDGRW